MLYLAVVSIIWAFSFGIIGSSLSGIDSYLVATLRLASASIVFLPFLRLKYIKGFDCLRLFVYGFIQFGLMYVFYMKAYQYLPSHLVALFSIFTPFYVVLINDIRKYKFSLRYIFTAFLSVTGAAVIKAQGLPSGDFWLGFILMQIAGIAFAFGQIAYRDWKLSQTEISDLNIFALLTLGGTFCAGLFSLILTNKASVEIAPMQWFSILYLGIVASGLGFFLWNKGATITNTGILAAFNNAVVPLAMLFSLTIFGEIEKLEFQELVRLIIGSIFIIIAIICSTKYQIKNHSLQHKIE